MSDKYESSDLRSPTTGASYMDTSHISEYLRRIEKLRTRERKLLNYMGHDFSSDEDQKFRAMAGVVHNKILKMEEENPYESMISEIYDDQKKTGSSDQHKTSNSYHDWGSGFDDSNDEHMGNSNWYERFTSFGSMKDNFYKVPDAFRKAARKIPSGKRMREGFDYGCQGLHDFFARNGEGEPRINGTIDLDGMKGTFPNIEEAKGYKDYISKLRKAGYSQKAEELNESVMNAGYWTTKDLNRYNDQKKWGDLFGIDLETGEHKRGFDYDKLNNEYMKDSHWDREFIPFGWTKDKFYKIPGAFRKAARKIPSREKVKEMYTRRSSEPKSEYESLYSRSRKRQAWDLIKDFSGFGEYTGTWEQSIKDRINAPMYHEQGGRKEQEKASGPDIDLEKLSKMVASYMVESGMAQQATSAA